MSKSSIKSKTSLFVVVWDCYGLEYVGNVTEYEQDQVWSTLTGKSSTVKPLANINHIVLRARFNSQRNYEIYFVTAVDGITADDIRDMFETNPQNAADTIREIGQQYYSDRKVNTGIVIN